jgi:hypothetical protein
MRPYPAAEIVPVEDGHGPVADDRVEIAALEACPCGLAVNGGDGEMAKPCDGRFSDEPRYRVVLGD